MDVREIFVPEFRPWDGDESKSHKDGEYIYVKAAWHPFANKRGYVKRHRLVIEKKLGYFIPKKSVVHHIDGNKKNDNVDNLELIPNQSIHSKSHDKNVRNKNGQFVASDPSFNQIRFRLFNKHTKQYELYDLSKLIRTTFRNSQFTFAGRYTGLKDKNGKEIYEGDVMQYDRPEIGRCFTEFVVFDDGCFMSHAAGKSDDPNYLFERQHFTVIGNIYENPELCQ